MIKTGECYYRDEAGALWLAESYVNEAGEVVTQSVEIEPAAAASGEANPSF